MLYTVHLVQSSTTWLLQSSCGLYEASEPLDSFRFILFPILMQWVVCARANWSDLPALINQLVYICILSCINSCCDFSYQCCKLRYFDGAVGSRGIFRMYFWPKVLVRCASDIASRGDLGLEALSILTMPTEGAWKSEKLHVSTSETSVFHHLSSCFGFSMRKAGLGFALRDIWVCSSDPYDVSIKDIQINLDRLPNHRVSSNLIAAHALRHSAFRVVAVQF